MNKIKVASDMMKLRNYLKKNDVSPQLEYENIIFNEKKQIYVYTYQAGFKTQKEAEMFKLFGNLIDISLLESK